MLQINSIDYTPNFLPHDVAKSAFYELLSMPWRQDYITVYGKRYPLPRLQQWFGNDDTKYTWSGIEMKPEPWTPLLKRIKAEVEDRCNYEFNSVLLNLYRDGMDTVGFHSDDEPELGRSPTIASVSLGAKRDFVLRHKYDKNLKLSLPLEDGSLLLMFGDTQLDWQHSLPRRKNVTEPRINLTFRYIHNNNSGV